MIESLLIQAYVKNINNEIQLVTNILASGQCGSFDEYKKNTGIIKGLMRSKTILNNTIKFYSDDDVDYDD